MSLRWCGGLLFSLWAVPLLCVAFCCSRSSIQTVGRRKLVSKGNAFWDHLAENSKSCFWKNHTITTTWRITAVQEKKKTYYWSYTSDFHMLAPIQKMNFCRNSCAERYFLRLAHPSPQTPSKPCKTYHKSKFLGVQNFQSGSKLRRKYQPYSDTFPTYSRKCLLSQAEGSSCTCRTVTLHRCPHSGCASEAQPQPGWSLSPFSPLPSLFHFLPRHREQVGCWRSSSERALRLSWVTCTGPSWAALLSVFSFRGGLNYYQPELVFSFSSCCFYFRPKAGFMCPKPCLIFPTIPIGIRSEFTFAYKPCPESASCPWSQGHKKQRRETVKLQNL